NPPADGTDWGRLFMLGSSTNVLTLNGNSTTTWTGRLVVNSGIVRAANPGAFGANGTFIYSTSGTFVGSILAGTTHVSGAANTGRVELTGGLIFAPETLVLEGRTTATNTGFANFSGNNTWTGAINIDTNTGPT